MLKLIDIPAIRRLEDHFILNNLTIDNVSELDEGRVDDVTKDTFGIIDDDLDTIEDPDYEPSQKWTDIEKETRRREWDNYYGQFNTIEMTDLEIAAYFLCSNIDARDNWGQPLRCLLTISRVVEAAALGIAGYLPKKSDLEQMKWENSLAAEARAYKRKQS